jgi:hypothetical protein
MATFTLVVRPDGSALLTTAEPLTSRERAHLLEELRGWASGGGVALIPDCEIVLVRNIEIDLGEPKAVV